VAWSRELSSGTFAAAPVIADVDADSQLDVAVTSFTGDVDVIRGLDSEHKRRSHWPVRLNDVTVHASLLQVCILCISAVSLIYDNSRVLSAAFVWMLLFATCRTLALSSWHDCLES